MHAALTALKRDALLRHNAVFFTGSMVASFLNYLYHPVLSRLMPPAQFGEVQAVISLFLQATILLNVLGMVALNIVSHRSEEPHRQDALIDLQALGLLTMAALAAGLALFSPLLAEAFRFSSPLPFALLGALLLISVPVTMRRFYLQAQHAFGKTSIVNGITAGGRLLVAVLLVLIGFETAGAVGALVIAQLAALAYALWHTGHVPSLALTWRPRLSPPVRRELRYALLVLCAFGLSMFLVAADVVLAKRFFSQETAGLYSGVATVARIIFFATASIAGVLLATAKRHEAPETNRRALVKSLLLFGAIGGAALIAISAAPDLILTLLVGSQYAAFADALPRLALMVFLASLSHLLSAYLLAQRVFLLIPVALIGVSTTLGALLLEHASVLALINAFVYGASVSLALLVALVALQLRTNGAQAAAPPKRAS